MWRCCRSSVQDVSKVQLQRALAVARPRPLLIPGVEVSSAIPGIHSSIFESEVWGRLAQEVWTLGIFCSNDDVNRVVKNFCSLRSINRDWWTTIAPSLEACAIRATLEMVKCYRGTVSMAGGATRYLRQDHFRRSILRNLEILNFPRTVSEREYMKNRNLFRPPQEINCRCPDGKSFIM